MRSTGPAVPRGSRRQGIPASSLPAISSAIPGEHLRGAGAVVEPHERFADDEAALRQPTAFAGQRHGRLESRHVVVGEVADDGQPQLLGFIESDDPRAGTHPRMTAEPAPLDRLENEARGSRIAQAQVRPERGEEVGVDRRRHRSPKRKRPPGEVSGKTGGCSGLAHAPASPTAPPGPGASGDHRRERTRDRSRGKGARPALSRGARFPIVILAPSEEKP